MATPAGKTELELLVQFYVYFFFGGGGVPLQIRGSVVDN